MSDKERVQAALDEMVGFAGGSLAVRTLYTIMQRFLEYEGDEAQTGGMSLYAKIIGTQARRISEEPGNWTYKGRFSEALFDHRFIDNNQDSMGINADIKDVLIKLDQAYGKNFSIESAIHYLHNIVECSARLAHEIKIEGQ